MGTRSEDADTNASGTPAQARGNHPARSPRQRDAGENGPFQKRPRQLPEYLARFSAPAVGFFKVSFSGRKKIMDIDARPPIENRVSVLGLLLAACDSLADSSRCQPFSGEEGTLTWVVALRARGSAALLLGLRGMGDVPRKSFSSE
jgi:hypothetical protein